MVAGTSKADAMPDTTSRPPTWKVLVLATRPNTLAASFTPVLVGFAVASRELGALDPAPAFRFWVFACLIQIGTNLHNDYADFVKGADTDDRVGQARATQKGWLSPGQTAGLSTAALVAAASIGASLARRPGCGGWMTFVTITSVFNALAYTGGPFPLGYVGLGNVSIGYSGLGDVFVFAYFGLVATLAPYYLALEEGAPRACPGALLAAAGSPLFMVALFYGQASGAISNTVALAERRYGDDPAFAEYVSSTPLIVPTPQSLARLLDS